MYNTHILLTIVHGNWGVWGAWNSCSTTYGDGILTRLRSCDNPAPAHGGSDCQGNDTESTPCPGICYN